MHPLIRQCSYLALSASLLITAPITFAARNPDISIVGTTEIKLPINNKSMQIGQKKNAVKIIRLQKIYLSRKVKQHVAKEIEEVLHEPKAIMSGRSYRRAVQLGMNDLPVLDQGPHGTCVTFAVTAAIDAFLKKTPDHDYISQLCNLELGETLALENPDYPSGWEGSDGSIVLKQMTDYGIITKQYQKTQGCAGKFEYDDSEGVPMSKEEFIAHHELVMPNVPYTTLFALDDFPSRSSTERRVLLNQIRSAIDNNHRVVFGTLVPMFVDGTMIGTNAKFHERGDSWSLTSSITELFRNENLIINGHEMIVTGYDDNAVVTDVYGHTHKGVFTIRNSWGTDVGDKGEYYISYDFFSTMAIEAHEIG